MLSIASVIGHQVETRGRDRASDELCAGGDYRADGGRGLGWNRRRVSPWFLDCRFSHMMVREALYKNLPVKTPHQLQGEIGSAIDPTIRARRSITRFPPLMRRSPCLPTRMRSRLCALR